MEPHEFKQQLDELQTIIADGIAYFTAWRGVRVEDEDSAHALNRYRGFFLPAQLSLKQMALLQLAKVFDHDPRTVSLRNLFSAAKGNREFLTPYATENDLQDLERQIDSNEALLKRLKGYRDQRLAHHDSIIAGDVSLPYGEVKQLVEDIKSMYNSLRRGHDNSYTVFKMLAADAERHTSQVVRIMLEERERAIRRIPKADTTT